MPTPSACGQSSDPGNPADRDMPLSFPAPANRLQGVELVDPSELDGKAGDVVRVGKMQRVVRRGGTALDDARAGAPERTEPIERPAEIGQPVLRDQLGEDDGVLDGGVGPLPVMGQHGVGRIAEDEGMACRRYPLRKDRNQFSRRPMPRFSPRLDQALTGPNHLGNRGLASRRAVPPPARLLNVVAPRSALLSSGISSACARRVATNRNPR